MDVNILACFLIFWAFLASRGTGGIQLSSKQDVESKSQFKQLNKPSVKTIKTEYGDVYDCVDFYKQPAFDHPLLKNHTFHPEMRPSFLPKGMNTASQETDALLNSMRLKDGGCPTGTVPIRRVSKGDHAQIHQFTEDYASRTKRNSLQPAAGHNFAVVQSKPDGAIYNGIGGKLSLHNPRVGPSQYSSAQMIAQNGDDLIEVGWMVNPTVYKDNFTRLFQYLDAGESHCFNTYCPGFVSVSTEIALGAVMGPMSIYGEKAYVQTFFIYQDEKNGNWWFVFGRDSTVVGFWPQQIFTKLSNSATYVAVGGETYSPPNLPLPQMGNGRLARYEVDPLRLAYCSHFFVVDANHTQIDTQNTEEFSNNDQYGAVDYGRTGKLGRMVFYGGTYL